MIRRLAALVLSLGLRSFDLVHDQVRKSLRRPIPCIGVILYYHSVKPHQRSRFAKQMDELVRNTRPFPAGSPEAIAPGQRCAAITFDDGFRSVVDNAVPELEKRHIPFTMFVPSGCLGSRPTWIHDQTHPSWDECVLSAAELRALASVPLATVGSHSITHPNLLELDCEHVVRELVESRKDLQNAVGSDIELFSFPHGAFNAELLSQARQAGYRRVFTIEPATVEPNPDAFMVGRVAADPEDWLIEFRLKLSGAYRWRHYLHGLSH